MENAMAPGPHKWWEEISCKDVLGIIMSIFFEFVKLASARASVAAEIDLEITKQKLDSPTRSQKIEEYDAANMKYAIVFYFLETIFMVLFLKSLIPVAPAVHIQVLRRENDTLRKNVDKFKKEGVFYRAKWREANTDRNNLKIEISAMERRALDAEEKLGHALVKLELARAEAVKQEATVIPEDVTDT